MHKVLASALLLCAVALPARAADLSTIDCIQKGADAALRERIEQEVARNLAETGKRPNYDPAIGEGLRKVGAACATEHGWSEAATRSAVVYTLAKLGLPIAQRVIDERGLEAGALEEQFQALPEETRNRPLTTPEMQGLVRASITDEAKQTRENAELLNEFFMFHSTVQYAAYDFSQA